MTDKLLKLLINRLNNGNSKALFHLHSLTNKVVFGKVWLKKPKNIIGSDGPFNFYFIKNENETYVATILDMNSDLHWFVMPKYRGNGYLTKALQEVILFHLFQNRQEQRITIKERDIGIKNFRASENVAKKVGFVKVGESESHEYILTIEKYKTDKFINGQNIEISHTRFEELRNQINYIANSLWVVQTEIEMKYGYSEFSEDLKETVGEIKRHIWSFEDAWFESKNK